MLGPAAQQPEKPIPMPHQNIIPVRETAPFLNVRIHAIRRLQENSMKLS